MWFSVRSGALPRLSGAVAANVEVPAVCGSAAVCSPRAIDAPMCGSWSTHVAMVRVVAVAGVDAADGGDERGGHGHEGTAVGEESRGLQPNNRASRRRPGKVAAELQSSPIRARGLFPQSSTRLAMAVGIFFGKDHLAVAGTGCVFSVAHRGTDRASGWIAGVPDRYPIGDSIV